MVAYKRFDATVISRALYLYYHKGWGFKRICDELDGPSFWVIRRWVRQFRSRCEAVFQVMGRFGESVAKTFKDRAVEVFAGLRRFAVKCGLDEVTQVIQAVQPILLGNSTQVPLFRSE